MMATTLVSLAQLLFNKYLPAGNYPLSVTALLLIAPAIGVILIAVKKFVFQSPPAGVN